MGKRRARKRERKEGREEGKEGEIERERRESESVWKGGREREREED